MDTPIDVKLPQDGSRRASTPPSQAHVAGWGVDLDRTQRPGVPMERRPPRLEAAPPVTPMQAQQVEVLHSIERSGLTPVFGTTCPPRGISGALRRRAFRYSESDLRHWLMLLAADRIDMVEGIASDLARGHVPNLYREMGGPAELRHNPRGAARKALVLLTVAGVAWWALKRRSSKAR
jgi:hypothetical protein